MKSRAGKDHRILNRKLMSAGNNLILCRSRADQYRTMYKKKIHDAREDREKSVKIRRDFRDQKEKDNSLNHHLAEWRNY